MLNKKYLLILILPAIAILLSACNNSSKLGTCHLRDGRFACHGNLQNNGQGELKFDKVPNQEKFQLSQFSLQQVDANGDSMPFRDCSGDVGDINTSRTFKFNCQNLAPNTYYVKFKLKHQMPKDYQPRKTESCVLIRNGAATNWQCTTSGEFKYIIE